MRLKLVFSLLVSVGLLSLSTKELKGQASSWQNCPNGTQIVRCETYDCPQGDTNQDGTCTLSDTGAKLSDSRNNSLCANPASGCGEVRYYPKDTKIACAVRVKESGDNCNLYNAGGIVPTSTPKPTPTSTPKPSPTATPLVSATASASPTTKGGLPATGPSFLTIVALFASGIFGFYLYERGRVA